MGKKEYYLYVKGKAVPVSEEVYKAYWKITEHEKYLERKDRKHNVISFSALDHDGHFVDNIADERIDLEKIVEVKLQIEELYKALATLTKEEKELMKAIFYREEKVENMFVFNSFEELYKKLPLLECGYTENDVSMASPDDMNQYYSKDKQMQYGVVGIKIRLI